MAYGVGFQLFLKATIAFFHHRKRVLHMIKSPERCLIESKLYMTHDYPVKSVEIPPAFLSNMSPLSSAQLFASCITPFSCWAYFLTLQMEALYCSETLVEI
jgi:hypothetical protein